MKTKAVPVLLQPRMKKFADEYIVSGNSSDAARKAGYSAKSAGVTGNKLRKRPDIQEYIAQCVAEATESTEEDLKTRVIEELKSIAFSNIDDFIRVDDDGRPIVDFSTATRAQLRSIVSVKSKTRHSYDREGKHIGTEHESGFTMGDKLRGLDGLAKTLGIYKADEQRVVLDVADRLLRARGRLHQLSDGEEEKFS